MASDEQAKREKDRQFQDEALRWLPDVTRYALSLTRDEADADDLIQETFLRAYHSWDPYTPRTEARGWLFTICRNLFVRARQRESTGPMRRPGARGARRPRLETVAE